MKKIVGFCFIAVTAVAAATPPVFQTDFEKEEIGKVPDSFLVMEGGWAVREADGNKYLELPGAPLESFSILFGPTEIHGFSACARIHCVAKGRRAPAFGVGLNGNGGFKLQVSAQKKQLELFRGEDALAAAPFVWESGSWTLVKLQVRQDASGGYLVEGKAWKQGATEPVAWQISQHLSGNLNPGRASVFGNPFSGVAIRFDDLIFAPAEG